MSRVATMYLKSRAWDTVKGICDHIHLQDVQIEHTRIDHLASQKPRVKVVSRGGTDVFIFRR